MQNSFHFKAIVIGMQLLHCSITPRQFKPITETKYPKYAAPVQLFNSTLEGASVVASSVRSHRCERDHEEGR